MAEKKTDKKRSQSETLRKVFRCLGKYRIFVVFSILLAAVSVAQNNLHFHFLENGYFDRCNLEIVFRKASFVCR